MASLSQLVDQLIKENRQLKQALARVEKAQPSTSLGQATKTLSGIQRRLNRALESAATTRRRRSTAAATVAARPRRKVTDPEVIEQRRRSLEKARAARKAKREAAAGPQ